MVIYQTYLYHMTYFWVAVYLCHCNCFCLFPLLFLWYMLGLNDFVPFVCWVLSSFINAVSLCIVVYKTLWLSKIYFLYCNHIICEYGTPKILNVFCNMKCKGYSLVYSEVMSRIYSVLYFNQCALSNMGFS